MVTVYFRIIDNTGSEYFGNIECQNWESQIGQIKRIMNVYGLKDEKQVNILDVVNKS